MKFIPTSAHGVLDYLTAALLVAMGFLIPPEGGAAAKAVPLSLGVATVIYSLCTRYEFGAWRVLPMGAHLGLDAVQAVVLGASPWLFGFSTQMVWPHLGVAVFEVIVVAFSQSTPWPPGPSHGETRVRGKTPTQLRAAIDQGRTGDKVDFPDPAAAPLGTDDEAGGTPARRA